MSDYELDHFRKAIEESKTNTVTKGYLVEAAATAESEDTTGPRPPQAFAWRGDTVELTATEIRIVEYLWRQPNRTANKMGLARDVWGDEEKASSSLPGHMSRINGKFARKGWALTLRAVGDFIQFMAD